MRKEHYYCHLCTTDNVYYRLIDELILKTNKIFIFVLFCFLIVILIYFVIIIVQVIISVKSVNVKMYNLQMYLLRKLNFVHIKQHNIVKLELRQGNWVLFQLNFKQEMYVNENNRMIQLIEVNLHLQELYIHIYICIYIVFFSGTFKSGEFNTQGNNNSSKTER